MNKRAILQLDLQGNIIQEHESTKMAARSVQGEGAAISHAAIKNKPYKGFLWKYAEPLPPRRSKIEILEEWNINLIQDLEERINELPRYYITSKIHQIQYNNDTINEILMQEQEQPIEKKTGHGRPSIPIKQFNEHGQYIKTFASIKEASIETNETPDKIRSVINGKTQLTPRGWHYKKVETKTKQKETKEKEETIDENFFYMPKDKENRKKMLKNYIESRLGTYMMHLTKHQQILERKFLQTIIKSL